MTHGSITKLDIFDQDFLEVPMSAGARQKTKVGDKTVISY